MTDVKLAWTVVDCVMMVMSSTLLFVLFFSATGASWDVLVNPTGLRIAFVLTSNTFMFTVYYAISKVRWRQDQLSLPSLVVFLCLAIALLIRQEMQFSMLVEEGVPRQALRVTIVLIAGIGMGILALFAMLSTQAEKRAEMETQANTAALTRKHYNEIKSMYQGMIQQ